MTTPVPDHGTVPWLDRFTDLSGEIMIEAGVTQSQLREIAAEMERRALPVVLDAMENGDVARLTAQVRRAHEAIRTVEAFGTGYIWRRDGQADVVLDPAEVVTVVAADKVASWEQLIADRNAMLPVVEAAKAHVEVCHALDRLDARFKGAEHDRLADSALDTRGVLIAAVDQMATQTTPGSPLPAENVPDVSESTPTPDGLVERLTARITAAVLDLLREELR